MHGCHGDLGGRRQQQRHRLRGREHHPAVPAGQAAGTGPHDLPGGGQLVEHGGLVARNPAGEHQGLQRRGGQRRAGELIDRVEDRVGAGRVPATGGPPRRAAPPAFGGLARVLPGGQERRQRLRWRRLDLLAELGQAPAAQHAEHLRVTPLGAPAAGHELALDDAVLGGEAVQRAGDHGDAQPVAAGRGLRGERPVAPGVPGHQVTERVGDRFGERHRHPGRQRHPECVPQPAARPRSPPTGPRRRSAPRSPAGRRPVRPASPRPGPARRSAARPPPPTAAR